ncbi:hypothetical protein [Amnibacterium kyonggiense]|uniref:Uncharacterized protein n=1 Tax=Amnibacterium kyonggiense TaxID=595671 RepID=A0A4R7FPJ4_9MICO|nr:hypothetical protein [Amnibacterium kyonggiense]TDS79548.1 hypothetical protein CLV52_0079 [Amnibacterium kyonggiense]
MDARRRRQGVDTYDLGLGFFGFFAVAFFAVSLFLQVTGRDPIWASLAAIVSFAILGAVWLFRRRYIARSTRSEDEA